MPNKSPVTDGQHAATPSLLPEASQPSGPAPASLGAVATRPLRFSKKRLALAFTIAAVSDAIGV